MPYTTTRRQHATDPSRTRAHDPITSLLFASLPCTLPTTSSQHYHTHFTLHLPHIPVPQSTTHHSTTRSITSFRSAVRSSSYTSSIAPASATSCPPSRSAATMRPPAAVPYSEPSAALTFT